METHEMIKTQDTHKGRRKHKMERKGMIKNVKARHYKVRL